MAQFMIGANVMAAVVVGLFFLKFWWRSRDRLFLAFACSFWLQGAARVGVLFSSSDEGTLWYVARLLAFLLIAGAIWGKNRSARSSSIQPT